MRRRECRWPTTKDAAETIAFYLPAIVAVAGHKSRVLIASPGSAEHCIIFDRALKCGCDAAFMSYLLFIIHSGTAGQELCGRTR